MRVNRSMPQAAVIPVLSYPDVLAAAQWLEDVFGFQIRVRMGTHRAHLQFGDGAVVVKETPAGEHSAVSLDSVMVRVTGIDAHFEHARARGAKIVEALQDYPYGERQYSCLDLVGRVWNFSETIADVEPAAWGGTLAS